MSVAAPMVFEDRVGLYEATGNHSGPIIMHTGPLFNTFVCVLSLMDGIAVVAVAVLYTIVLRRLKQELEKTHGVRVVRWIP